LSPQAAAQQLEKQLRERVERLPGAKVTPPAHAATSGTPKPVVKPSVTMTNNQTQQRGTQPVPNPFDVGALNKAAEAELVAMLNSSKE
jgi:hypothetical protein